MRTTLYIGCHANLAEFLITGQKKYRLLQPVHLERSGSVSIFAASFKDLHVMIQIL